MERGGEQYRLGADTMSAFNLPILDLRHSLLYHLLFGSRRRRMSVLLWAILLKKSALILV